MSLEQLAPDPAEQSIELVHRPETETPLKNGKKGERFIALSGDVCEVLELGWNSGGQRVLTTTVASHC